MLCLRKVGAKWHFPSSLPAPMQIEVFLTRDVGDYRGVVVVLDTANAYNCIRELTQIKKLYSKYPLFIYGINCDNIKAATANNIHTELLGLDYTYIDQMEDLPDYFCDFCQRILQSSS